jgi:hypothetical protein
MVKPSWQRWETAEKLGRGACSVMRDQNNIFLRSILAGCEPKCGYGLIFGALAGRWLGQRTMERRSVSAVGIRLRLWICRYLCLDWGNIAAVRHVASQLCMFIGREGRSLWEGSAEWGWPGIPCGRAMGTTDWKRDGKTCLMLLKMLNKLPHWIMKDLYISEEWIVNLEGKWKLWKATASQAF